MARGELVLLGTIVLYSVLGLTVLPGPSDLLQQQLGGAQGLGLDVQKIVNSIVRLAHELDLVVVAEGVETEDIQDYLKSIDCDLAQGYLYGRPAPATLLPSLPIGPVADVLPPDRRAIRQVG